MFAWVTFQLCYSPSTYLQISVVHADYSNAMLLLRSWKKCLLVAFTSPLCCIKCELTCSHQVSYKIFTHSWAGSACFILHSDRLRVSLSGHRRTVLSLPRSVTSVPQGVTLSSCWRLMATTRRQDRSVKVCQKIIQMPSNSSGTCIHAYNNYLHVVNCLLQ